MCAVTLQASKSLKEGAVLVGPMHDAAGPANARVLGHAARSGSCGIALPHCPAYRGRAGWVLLPGKDVMQRRMPIWALQNHQQALTWAPDRSSCLSSISVTTSVWRSLHGHTITEQSYYRRLRRGRTARYCMALHTLQCAKPDKNRKWFVVHLRDRPAPAICR